MSGSKTRLRRLQRELDKVAPAEPIVIHIVYHDANTGERTPGGEVVVDGRAQRVIQLCWPEDEDDEKRARDVAPGRA